MSLAPARPSLPIRGWEVLFLLVLILVHCVLGAWWIQEHQRPPVSDGPGHILQLKGFLHHLEASGTLHLQPFPPLTYAVSSVAWVFLGHTVEAARQSILAFLVVFIASCWWLGRELGGRGGGVTTALGAAGSPWVGEYSRAYFLDFPAAALVAFALAALVASKGYRRPAPTLLFGLALALAMLTKWSVLFFLLLPAVALALRTMVAGSTSAILAAATVVVLGEVAGLLASLMANLWVPRDPHGFPADLWVFTSVPWMALLVVASRNRFVDARPGEWNPGAGLALAVGLGTLGCLPWYLYALPEIHEKILYEASDPTPFDFRLSLTLNSLFVANALWAGPVWLAAGTLAGMITRETRRLTFLLAAGLATSLLWVSSVSPHDPRYVLPLLPFQAALSFAWMGRVKGLAPAVAVVLAGLSAVQTHTWFLESVGLPTPPNRHVRAKERNQLWDRPGYPEFWSLIPAARRPDGATYPMRETLVRATREGATRITVVYTDSAGTFGDSFFLLSHMDDLPLALEKQPWSGTPPVDGFAILLWGFDPAHPERPDPPEWVRDYVEIGSWEGGSGDFNLRWNLLKPAGAVPQDSSSG